MIPVTLKVTSDVAVLWYPSTEDKFKLAINMPGVFLQNSSTLGLVSQTHIHNRFILI